YEMLSGRPAFEGEDVTEILGRIVTAEPDWGRLPAGTQWLIQRLLRRALTKDSRQRLGDIRDARIEIEDAGRRPPWERAGGLTAAAKRRVRVAWFAAVLALIIAGLFAIPAIVHLREGLPPEIRVEVNAPSTGDPESFAISPDGRRLVFSASNE